MAKKFLTCSFVFESMTMSHGPIPVNNSPGIGWESVNLFISIWKNIGANSADSFRESCYIMCAMYVAQQDISRHTGSLVELSSRAVAALSMTDYDTIDLGPNISGLNDDNLSPSNPFGTSGVGYPEAKSALLHQARIKYEHYRTLVVAGSTDPTREFMITPG